ncbi:MAG: phosphate ABC transporter substrate-binding protein PstS [Actinomycetes bacterium]|nr:phosphate ABC transporter substrate-binding protein PstS [Actinomycetes bacterium]MDX5380603.1 phosphate ABC transporter substrate-binding protein PstS [Actinomycetes bacterium]MDX5399528.1 phosphate ABC transporter substrate-binding protein PstS [Actinomycetes bacterium]
MGHARGLGRRTRAAVIASALAVVLSACGRDAVVLEDGASSDLRGDIAGSGSSAQEKAQNAWVAEFSIRNTGVIVSYDPTGSGAGREQFITGTVDFAGTDAALKPDEIEGAIARCSGSEPLELPLYISPIAIVYNLPDLGVDHLNMTPAMIAQAFTGEISRWDDPAIAAVNPDAELPDLPIIPVNRSDESGTTESFAEYLAAAAGEAWPHEPDGVWPITGTQSGAQTSGVLEVVTGAEGTFAYVDASRAGDLGTVAVGVGDEFVPFSSEAAARVLEISEPTEDASDLRLTYELARDTTESGTYPVVMVSYLVACSTYRSAVDAENVAAYLSFIASTEGQEVASRPSVAGTAPITEGLRSRVQAAIDQISGG